MKKILINADKCTGCRTCEVVCSLMHTKGVINPRQARVRVFRDEVEGLYTPIIPGPKQSIEYVEEPKLFLQDKCGELRILCDLFTSPSQRCDRCGVCASWCVTGALTAEEISNDRTQ